MAEHEFILALIVELSLRPQFTRIILLDLGKIAADGPMHKSLSEPGLVKGMWEQYQAKLQ